MRGNVLLNHMNDETASIIDDSGSGNTGTIGGDILINRSGFVDNLTAVGFLLGGAVDVITYADGNVADFGSNFSITFWINLSSFGQRRVIMSKVIDATEFAFVIQKPVSDSIMIRMDDGTGTDTFEHTTVLPANEFIHVAIVIDNSTPSNVAIYINGSSDKATGTINKRNNGGVFTIGDEGLGGAEFNDITMVIDEVAIFNRSLSDMEIDGIFNAGSGQSPPTTTTTTTTLTTTTTFAGVTGEAYPRVGGLLEQFNTGIGIFARGFTAIRTGAIPVTRVQQPSLVADLDGDGRSEIIIQDGTTIKIFQNSTLQGVQEFIMDDDGEFHVSSNMVIFDYDNDGKQEIFIMNAFSNIRVDFYVLEFDGTTFTNESRFNSVFTSVNFNDGELMLGCGDTDTDKFCLLVSNRDKVFFNLNTPHIITKQFNFSGGVPSITEALIVDSIKGMSCLPRVKLVSLSDYDDDGKKEWIFSWWLGDLTESEKVKIAYIDIDDNSLDQPLVINTDIFTADFPSGAGTFCNDSISGSSTVVIPQSAFTSPLVANINSFGATKETVIGVMTDISPVGAEAFKMFSYDIAGNEIDEYPSKFEADGVLLSNPFLADAYPDTGRTDFCVTGFDTVSEEIDILCASELSAFSITVPILFPPFTEEVRKSFEFKAVATETVNLDYNRYDVISHSGEHDDTTKSFEGSVSKNIDEVITPLGIFQLDWETASPLPLTELFVRTADLLFPNPESSGAIVMADAQDVGAVDMLIMTGLNFFYYDDFFVNQPPSFTYDINPCLDTIAVKINETVTFTAITDDVENDDVRMQIKAYAGTDDEQLGNPVDPATNFTTFVQNGQVLQQTVVLNVTGAGILAVAVGDDASPFLTTRNFSYSVAVNGVVVGDCTQSGEVDPPEPPLPVGVTTTTQTDPNDPNEDDNVIADFLDQFNVNLGIGRGILWLIFMGVVAYSLFFFVATHGGNTSNAFIGAAVVVLIAELILFIIGALLGFFSFAVIIIIVVIGIVILGIFLANRLTGTANM